MRPLNQASEERENPLDGTKIVINSGRRNRPQNGNQDAACPFCPGNEHLCTDEIWRLGNGNGAWNTRIVSNLFNALSIEADKEETLFGPYKTRKGYGAHNVIIETPHHEHKQWDFEYGIDQLVKVFITYRHQFQDLKDDPSIRSVIIFKMKVGMPEPPSSTAIPRRRDLLMFPKT